MRLRDRGMVKWAPYKSLPEQEEYLEMMEESKQKVSKPDLSEDELQEINDNLVSKQKGDDITISFYHDGQIREISDKLCYIDVPRRSIVLSNRMRIAFTEVLALK